MTRYAPYYCEENVYWLAQEARFEDMRREVLFISNPSRTVALFSQRAAPAEGEPVVWDYHVVLAVYAGSGVEVWDLDCTGGAPLPARTWLELGFEPARGLPKRFSPRFRVIDADEFVSTFSSDRSHMRAPDGSWLQPPPGWPPIVRGPSNLMRFVDVRDPIAGELLDLRALRQRWRLDQ